MNKLPESDSVQSYNNYCNLNLVTSEVIYPFGMNAVLKGSLDEGEPIILDKDEVISIVVHGIHGPVNHGGLSNSQWRKLDVQEKYAVSYGVDIANAVPVIYRNVEYVREGSDITIVKYRTIEYFKEISVVELSKAKNIIVTLSAGVWLKVALPDANLPCLVCGVLEFKQPGSGFRPRLSDDEMRLAILKACAEMKALFGHDQVFEAQMLSMLNGVSENFDSAMHILPETYNLVKDSRSAINKIEQFYDDLRVDYTTLVNKVSKFFEQFIPQLGTSLLEYAVLFVDFVYAFINNLSYMVISCIIRLCAKLGIVESVITELLKYVGKIQPFGSSQVRENVLVAQGNYSYSLVNVIIAVTGVLILKKMPALGDLKSVTEGVRSFNVFLPASTSLASLIQIIPKILPDVVKAWWEHLCPAEEWVRLLESDFPTWYAEVESLTRVSNEDKIRYDVGMQNQLKSLHDQGQRYMLVASRTPEISTKLFQMLMKAAKKIDDFQAIADAALGGRSVREEPFSIYISGPSNIGKSHCIYAIASILCPEGRDKNNLVYNRSAASEYWDGYTGQFCVAYDDFGQVVDKGDFAEFFDVVNTTPFIPNMASLDNPRIGTKGTHFDSPLVIATANHTTPASHNEIRTPEALMRRRHLLFEVAAAGWLRNPNDPRSGIDFSRVPQNVLNNFEHLRWRTLNPTDPNTVTSSWMSSVDAFQMMRNGFVEHRKRTARGLRNLINGEFIARMRGEPLSQDFEDARELQAQGLMEYYEKTRSEVSGVIDKVDWVYMLEECKNAVVNWKNEHPLIYAFLSNMRDVLAFVGAFAFLTDFWNICHDPGLADQGSPTYDLGAKVRKPKTKQRFAQGNLTGTPKEIGQGYIEQEDIDPVGTEQVREIIANAMMSFTVTSNSGTAFSNTMCAFAFGYNLLLVPRHLFMDQDGEIIPDGTPVEVRNINGIYYKSLFMASNFYVLRNKDGTEKDSAVYRFGPTMRSYRNRVNMFISESNLMSVSNKCGMLVSIKNTRAGGASLNFHSLSSIKEITTKTTYSVHDKHSMILLHGWHYVAPTVRGECGAILAYFDKQATRRILGIHVAGNPKHHNGVSEIVTAEMLTEAIAHFPDLIGGLPAPSANILDESPRILDLYGEGNFSIIGRVSDKERLRLPDKTSLVPTKFIDKLGPHTMEPAVLTPKDPRLVVPVSPLLNGIRKYGVPCKPFDWDILGDIVDDMIGEFNLPNLEPLRVLSEHETINGICGKLYFDSINMQSSPGWPFKLLLKPGASKADLFGGEPTQYFIKDPVLRQRLDFRELCAKKGLRVPSAFVDCLKDEKRVLSKVYAGKTRVFAIAPIDFVLLMRKYCLSFAARMYGMRSRSFSAIGINCDSFEWAETVEYLLENSDVGFAGDFGRFDGTLSADCLWACCMLINRIHQGSAEENNVRCVLFDELIHTVHLAMDCAYICSGGNPSGNPLTVVVNTLVNEMYLRYAWLHLVPSQYASLPMYHNFVRTKIYGDDNWVSVSPEVTEWYNLHAVSQFLSSMGIEYTNPTKEHELGPAISKIVNLPFLKRKCNIVPQVHMRRYLGAVNVDTIIEMIYWTHKGLDESEALLVNVNTALRFAFSHGKFFFTELRERIKACYLSEGLQVPTLYSWSELLKEFRTNGGLLPENMFALEAQGDLKPMSTEQVMPGIEQAGAPDTERFMAHDNLHGITMADHELPVEEVGTRGAVDYCNERAHGNLQDQSWTLKMAAERYNYVGTYVWTTAFGVNSSIVNFEVPLGMLTTPTIQDPFERWVYWRGSPEILVEVNATRFMKGRAICFFVPLTSRAVCQTWHLQNRAAQTSVQHVFLDPSVSTVAKMKIPYVNWKNYLNIENPITQNDFLGMFYISVFNQLVVPTGAPNSVSITVFIRFNENEFKIPSTKLLTTFRNLEKYRQIGPAVGDPNHSREDEKEENLNDLEAQGNTVSSKTTNIIQQCADLTIPIETYGDKFDTNVKVSGMDKINVPTQAPYMTLKPFGYMNHCENLEFLNKMTLKPSALNMVDFEHFGTKQDEMNFKYLFTLPTFMYEGTFSSTSVTGFVLNNGYLGPMGMLFNVGPIAQAAGAGVQTWQPTLWEYAMMPYSFWRGGIRLHFDFVCDAFDTARLWLAINYGNNTPSLLTLAQYTAQYGAAIDINAENHHFTFDIPFLSPTPFKRIINGTGLVGAVNDNIQEFVLGTWSLVILNPLRTSTGTATQIKYNIFVSGMDDFEVAGLHMNNVSQCPLQAQGALDLTTPATMEQRAAGGPLVATLPQADTNVAMQHFGERYLSVREVIKRYAMTGISQGIGPSCAKQWPTEGTTGATYSYLVGLIDVGTEIMKGTMGWYARMYRAWRGSMRFKIVYRIFGTRIDTNGEDFRGFLPFAMYDTNVGRLGRGFQQPLGDTEFGSLMYAYGCGIPLGGTSTTGVTLAYGDTTFDWPRQNTETYGSYLPVWRSPPIDVARVDIHYSEIEVPFSTIYNILTTYLEPQISPSVGKNLGEISPGVIWVGINGDMQRATNLGMNFSYTTFTAAGDDFRFGLLMGPPTLQLNWINASFGPSTFMFDNY